LIIGVCPVPFVVGQPMKWSATQKTGRR
jgi:hypothetical protein